MSVQFTLTSDEGLPIRGNLDVPANAIALVILIHGFKGFKDWAFFPWLAECFADQRIAVCRFNMSRGGIGEDPEVFDRLDLFADDTYSVELSDLDVVVEYAQDRVRLPTFLLGHSRGGGVALLGAAGVPNLHGVVAWNPIAHADRWDQATKQAWRASGHFDIENTRTKQVMRLSPRVLDDLPKHDIPAAASALKVPLLIVHGGRDETVPAAESIALIAGDQVRIVIGSATHTFNAVHPMKEVPRQLELAEAATARFIAAHAE